ncbi:hypothetical protein KOR42_33090 [Thalassoglobus neptunius]|uniref:Phage head-tail joining protein domain-containing protein n=1 Tax=Thalassoglobus neptunius TaxID=1938619 RepID=A0A5C5WM03_9PLAN|nr:hypothetical protein [Thalassoglobus neptunius]TWT51836.1 hypothetical protein KOR42_33090 [Thalassoglobus neptunius]
MSFINSLIGSVLDVHHQLTGEETGVSYQATPASSPVALPGAVKSTKPRVLDPVALIEMETEVIDWLVRKSHFGVAGSFVPPVEGGEIYLTEGGLDKTYRVCRIGSEGCWRDRDSSGSYIRIHSTLVSEVPTDGGS